MNTEVQQSPSRENSDHGTHEDLEWQTDTNLSFGENLDEMDSSQHNIPHQTHHPRNDLVLRQRNKLRFVGFIDKCFESCLFPFMSSCCRNKFFWFIAFQFFLLLLRITKSMESYVVFFAIFTPLTLILIYTIYRYCKHSISRNRRPHQPRSEVAQNVNPNHIDERLLQQLVFNTLRHRLDQIRDHNLNDGRGRNERDFRRDLRNMLMEIRGFDEMFINQVAPRPAGLSESEISNIKLVKYEKKLNEDPELCSICIDEFKEEEELRSLACGHQFHTGCVDQWLKQSTNCPNCKAELRPEGAANPNAENQNVREFGNFGNFGPGGIVPPILIRIEGLNELDFVE